MSYLFTGTKMLTSITIKQLTGKWTSKEFTIQVLPPNSGSGGWETKKVEKNAGSTYKYSFGTNGVAADGVKILTTGNAPKDTWYRLMGIDAAGYNTNKNGKEAIPKFRQVGNYGNLVPKGTKCATHAKDPYWKGDCNVLIANTQHTKWSSKEGLHLKERIGWVQYSFTSTKLVKKVQVFQLNKSGRSVYVTPTFNVNLQEPSTLGLGKGGWIVAKHFDPVPDAYPKSSKTISTATYSAANAVPADSVRIEFVGRSIKNGGPWVRVTGLKVEGYSAQKL